MDVIAEFFQRLRNLDELIRWGGYTGLVLIVFAETGLLVGFFLPGDSLLVTAGLFAAKGDLDIALLMVLLSVAAIAGDTVGYWFGAKTGPPLYSRPNSRFFKRDHLLKAHAFYEKHGGKTIVLARFMPLIRTFAPIVAGVARMNYKRFLACNVCGGIGWVVSMSLLGYGLGQSIPNIGQHIEKVIVLVVFLSILPMIVHVWKERRTRSVAVAVEEPVAK